MMIEPQLTTSVVQLSSGSRIDPWNLQRLDIERLKDVIKMLRRSTKPTYNNVLEQIFWEPPSSGSTFLQRELENLLDLAPSQAQSYLLESLLSKLDLLLPKLTAALSLPNPEVAAEIHEEKPMETAVKPLSGREASVLALLAQIQHMPRESERVLSESKLEGQALRIGEIIVGGNAEQASVAEKAAAEGFSKWAKEL